MTIEQLLQVAEMVHGAAVNANWPAWRQFGRYECQEAFRREALAVGINDQTADMGFIVTKCLSLSGYGS